MRIELKDENQEEPQKIDENDIRYKHETDLTKKEKRELEKMKLASMGWKGKLQYIWAYYKPQMAAIVAVIAIAFFVKDLYENSRIHTALTVMVIDSYGTKQEEAAAHFPHHQNYAHTEAPPAAWYQTPDRKDFPHRKPWAADP